MNIDTLISYWVIVNKHGSPIIWSIGASKQGAIDNYAYGLGVAENIEVIWSSAKRRGHKAVNVNITFDAP